MLGMWTREAAKSREQGNLIWNKRTTNTCSSIPYTTYFTSFAGKFRYPVLGKLQNVAKAILHGTSLQTLTKLQTKCLIKG